MHLLPSWELVSHVGNAIVQLIDPNILADTRLAVFVLWKQFERQSMKNMTFKTLQVPSYCTVWYAMHLRILIFITIVNEVFIEIYVYPLNFYIFDYSQ